MLRNPVSWRNQVSTAILALAAGWLLGAGSIAAQTKEIPQQIIWPSAEMPRVVPVVPPSGEDSAGSRIKAATFTQPPAGPIQATAPSLIFKQAAGGGRPKPPAEGDAEGFTIRTELPGADRLFDRKSESQLFETYRLEAQARPGAQRVYFPPHVSVSKEKYAARNFKQMVGTTEPSFVMHRRLLFEQPNFDRHGWELGPIQPGISTLRFVYDVVALPYHAWTRPLEHWDSSAGKCLPGDDTPLLLYREPISLTGAIGQAGAVAGGFIAFP